MDKPALNRDEQGRFVPGGPGGPGRPRGFREELLRAADEAISPEHIAAIMRRAVRMALEGNLSAIRFVTERYCGRAAEAPAVPLAAVVELPRLRTAAECNVAIDRLAEAMSTGACDREAAKAFLDLIQVRLKAIEVNDLEQRLADLERAATVTTGMPRGRRWEP